MTDTPDPLPPVPSLTLEDLLLRLLGRLRAEEPADLHLLAWRYPEQWEELCRLLPQVRELARKHLLSATPAPISTHPQHLSDDFQVVRPLCSSSNGEVFEATQRSTNQRVALKVLFRPSNAPSANLHQAIRQAEQAVSVRHPQLVPALAAHFGPEYWYQAQEFMPLPTLHAWLDSLRARAHPTDSLQAILPPAPPLSPAFCRVAVAWVASLADAVACAHSQGLTHGDIKPSNLFFGPQGQLLLSDLGLAAFAPTRWFNGVRDLARTLPFRAPEQLLANQGTEPASDVYALGACLYLLLTLHTPFAAKDWRKLVALVMAEPVVPLRQRNRAVHPGLEAIVLRALSKDPDDRQPSAAALASELRTWLDGTPQEEKAAGWLAGFRKWWRS